METCLNTYYLKHQTLITKKEELFYLSKVYLHVLEDISKWEIKERIPVSEFELYNEPLLAYKYMCTDQNNLEQQLKDGYGYFS